ncbi:hypothetical protein Hanom_Chr17g01550721 [Helianthus anomalus]
MTIMPLRKMTKKPDFSFRNQTWFHFWTKMAIKVKPQGPRCKRFEIWTKMAKLTKPQGPK